MEAPVVSDAVIEWLMKLWPEELPMTDNPNDYYRAQGRKLMMDRLLIENRKQRI